MGVEGMSADRRMDGKKCGNKGLIRSEQIAYRSLIIGQLRGFLYGLSSLAVSVRQQIFPETFHFRQQLRVSSLQLLPVAAEHFGVQLSHFFRHFIGRNRGSLLVFQCQGRIGKQSAADDDACQSGEPCGDGADIFHGMQVSVVEKRVGALFVESFKSLQVYLSFVLLLAQTRVQDDVCEGEFIEQRKQGKAFFRLLPAQTQLHGETDAGMPVDGFGEQRLHFFGIGQHAGAIVAPGQHGKRTTQIDVRFPISFFDEKGHYVLQFVHIRSNELGDEVQARVVVRLNVTNISPPDFSVLHAYERRVISLYAAEDACMRPPVDGIGVALQGGEVDG